MRVFHIAAVARLMRIARVLSACMFVLLLVTAARALDPDRDIHQFVHRSWGQNEGYPGRAQDLAQTTDGFLWIATHKGLFRFDGVHFERYTPRSGDEFSDGPLRGLLALPDGSLWIAYRREAKICVLRNGNLKCYGQADGVTSLPTAIVQDHESILWANTERGVLRFNGARWEHIGKEWNFPEYVPNENSVVLFVDSQGTLWAGVNHTVLYLKQGSKRFEATGLFAVWTVSIAEARDGTIWLSDNFNYLRAIGTSVNTKPASTPKCKVEAAEEVPANCLSQGPPSLKISGLYSLLFDHNGSLWITSDISGVFRIPYPQLLKSQPSKARSVLQTFSAKDGLSADNCNPILEDREGNIWVATRDGLDQFRETPLVPVEMPTSIYQTAIAPADSGDIWIAGSWNFVARVHGDSKKVSLVGSDAPFKPYRDPAGDTWLMGNWLAKWEGGAFRKVAQSPDANLGSSGFWQIARDKFGKLWAFADGLGFFYLDHRRWEPWTTPKEVAQQHATNMYSDSAGRIWVSTYEGEIITMDKGRIQVNQLKSNSPLRYVEVFAEHSPQEIWAGGRGGLVLINGDLLQPFRPAALNSLENVTGIVDTGTEGLWLNSSSGVIHVPGDEVDRALRDRSYRFQSERFDSFDGLPGNTVDIYPYPKATEGTDGRIWFTAARGVAWINPKKRMDLRNVLPPPVSITSLSADGSLHLQLTELRLPAHTANVHINYTALSLSVPERVNFRYMLEGSDSNWQDVGTRREAFYTNLGPHHYRFRVIACNSDGVWNNVGASIDFTIAPAWYQTSWFFALCIVATVLIVFAAYRIRMRQVAGAINARFDERLAERTLIARDLHDTLLQTIQGSKLVADSALKRPADPSKNREALEQLSIWLARATIEGREALNSLRTSTTETNDLAEAFRRATEECRTLNSMETSFSVVGEVRVMHPIVRDEVYRVGYEAIRNACVHSHGSKLRVTLTYADELSVDIVDNGVGLDPLVAERGREGHFGLQGMRERAARIAGKLTVNSSPESGTTVRLVVPGKVIYRKATSHSH